MYFLWLILSAAVVYDLRTYKIPNYLLLFSYLCSCAGFLVKEGVEYTLCAMTISVVIGFLFYPLYLFGALGAGDVKLFIVISLFLGWKGSLNCLITAVFIGGVFSLFRLSISAVKNRSFPDKFLHIHFSIPIFLSAILTIYGGITWIKS